MALSDHALKVGDARILGIELNRTVENETSRVSLTSATIQVKDSDGEDVIAVVAATVSGTLAYYRITGADVTAAADTYTVIWRVTVGTEVIVETFDIEAAAV